MQSHKDESLYTSALPLYLPSYKDDLSDLISPDHYSLSIEISFYVTVENR